MTKDITIAIIAAFGGGLFTLVVAYLNTRAKRFELEYNFKCKMQENYHANAKLHIEDLYLPLYKRLASFENISKETNETNKQNTINEINELSNFVVNMKILGNTAFLVSEIEETLESFLKFIQDSVNVERPSYILIQTTGMLGKKDMIVRKSNSFRSKRKSFYSLLMFVNNLGGRLTSIFYFGLISYRTEIILESANITSNEFKEYVEMYLLKIKRGIKDITLGIK